MCLFFILLLCLSYNYIGHLSYPRGDVFVCFTWNLDKHTFKKFAEKPEIIYCWQRCCNEKETKIELAIFYGSGRDDKWSFSSNFTATPLIILSGDRWICFFTKWSLPTIIYSANLQCSVLPFIYIFNFCRVWIDFSWCEPVSGQSPVFSCAFLIQILRHHGIFRAL